MEIEQLFGQPTNEQNLVSLFDVILGLSILTLMVLFFFISIASLFNNAQINNPELPENSVTPVATGLIKTNNAGISQEISLTPVAITPLIQANNPNIQETSVIPVATQLLNTQTAQLTTSNEQYIKNSSQIQQNILRTLSIQNAIYQALFKEFQHDLPYWLAEIDHATLTMRFQNPDLFFDIGSSSLNRHYQSILSDFFPRYLKILQKHKAAIESISIEGHTSSEWRGSRSKDIAYFNNMALSQARTRAVLEYCLLQPSVSQYKEWLRSLLTANGLSSGRIIQENGIEKIEYSRRVEFRIHTW